jgi:hypothetical protein
MTIDKGALDWVGYSKTRFQISEWQDLTPGPVFPEGGYLGADATVLGFISSLDIH